MLNQESGHHWKMLLNLTSRPSGPYQSNPRNAIVSLALGPNTDNEPIDQVKFKMHLLLMMRRVRKAAFL